APSRKACANAPAACDLLGSVLVATPATIYRRMEEQPFVTAAMGPDTVKFLLKEHAQRTQQPVLDFLAQAQVRGDVRVYNSFWIVNAAVAEIRAGAVEKLATLPGVGLIYEEYTFSIEPNERVRQAADAPIWDSYATTFVYDVWEL